MRDRLIELLKQKSCVYMPCDNECGECKNVEMYDDSIESIVDHLLAEGVIVPPVKVGQTVYVPWVWGDQGGIASPIVECIQIVRDTDLCGFFIDMKSNDTAFNDVYGFWRTFAEIGKKVFLTREEAEKELAERSENGT